MSNKTLALACIVAALALARPGQAQQPAATSPAPAPSASATAPPAQNADEQAIRQQIAAFKAAFDKGDSDAIAAMYTEDGQVVGPDGMPTRGRKAIADQFRNYFAQNPGVTITLNVSGIRLLGADVAQEEGQSVVQPSDGSEPFTSQYSALYLRRDGKWLQQEVRDYPTPEPEPSAEEQALLDNPIMQLDWMIGEWVDESPESIISHSCRYILGGKFIVREYAAAYQGEDLVEGAHIIGYDPQTRLIRSWGFDGEGSHGEAEWARDGSRWVIKLTGVLGDGRSISATQILEQVNNDAMKLSAVERTIDGEAAPDRDEVLLVRKPPAPSIEEVPSAAPAETPAATTPTTAPATAPAGVPAQPAPVATPAPAAVAPARP